MQLPVRYVKNLSASPSAHQGFWKLAKLQSIMTRGNSQHYLYFHLHFYRFEINVKDHENMRRGQLWLSNSWMVRVRALLLLNSGFESPLLPMLLVEVSSSHIC